MMGKFTQRDKDNFEKLHEEFLKKYPTLSSLPEDGWKYADQMLEGEWYFWSSWGSDFLKASDCQTHFIRIRDKENFRKTDNLDYITFPIGGSSVWSVLRGKHSQDWTPYSDLMWHHNHFGISSSEEKRDAIPKLFGPLSLQTIHKFINWPNENPLGVKN